MSRETILSNTLRIVSTSSRLLLDSTYTEASSLDKFELEELIETKLDSGAYVFVAGEDSYLSYYTKESIKLEL